MASEVRRFTGLSLSGHRWLSIALLAVSCGKPQRGSAEREPDLPAPASVAQAGQERPAADAPGPTGPLSCPPPAGFEDLQATAASLVFDLRYATEQNFTGSPLPGYGRAAAWGVEGLGAALEAASQDLAEAGYRLVLYDAYRPPQASTAMVAFARSSGHQDWVDDGYIAGKSNHARGTTVDVGLIGRVSGGEVDLGSAFDTFGPASHFNGAKGPAMARRRLLRKAMVGQGFAPYGAEWWHFELRREPRPVHRLGDYACEARDGAAQAAEPG